MRFPLLALTLCACCVARAQTNDAPTYENVAASLKPIPIARAHDVLSRLDAYSGRTVEVRGIVRGLMSGERGRVCLLQMPDALLPLSAPPSITSPVLKPNARVRLLALVDAEGANGPLTILALREASAREVSVEAQDAMRSAAMLPSGASMQNRTVTVARPQPGGDNLVGNGSQSGEGLIVVPPGTDAMLPEAPPFVVPPQTSRSVPDRITPSRSPSNRAQSAPRVFDIEGQIPSYTALVRRHNPRLSEAQATEIASALLRHGYANNLDPRFLASVIAVESGFNPYALSRSGAMGLGQIMPFNLRSLGIANAWNVSDNVRGSARMLRRLLDQFGRQPNGTLLAVAAYNAGPNAVKRAGYRVPNGAQVQGYVWKIYHRYKAFAPDMFR